MTPEQFCYWLQGFFELSGQTSLTDEQVEMVKKHLQTVFINVTGDPSRLNEALQKVFPGLQPNAIWQTPTQGSAHIIC